MERYVLIIALMAMFVSTAVFAQGPGRDRGRPEGNMEDQMRLRGMRLEMEKREAELDFHREMQEPELKQRRAVLKHERRTQKHPCGGMLPFVIVCFVVHILMAVWVYKDIRRRNSGSGIWIVVALLAGLFGVLVYAVVRLGDTRQTKS